MTRLTLISTLLFITCLSYSQQNILVFKKKNKVIERFWQGQTIAFQTNYKVWQKGKLIRIQNDSIYVQSWLSRATMSGVDTLRYEITGYSLPEIYALPKRGVLIHYANGHFEIAMDGGHQHFYWVKSGWIFRLGAAGYTTLHIINGLIKKDLSISNSAAPIGIAAGVFAAGVVLQKTYKLTHRLGKRYHLEIFSLSK